jgi:hypothetical protein
LGIVAIHQESNPLILNIHILFIIAKIGLNRHKGALPPGGDDPIEKSGNFSGYK